MAIEQSEIDELVNNLSESLNVEVKRWIDPRTPGGEAKIVQATIALRNRNGGFLVIGFDNETMAADDEANRPLDWEGAFHVDVVQAVVSKHASTPFEVFVGSANRDGAIFPVIRVPPGVTVPVATKREIVVGGKTVILQDRVYFRTLNSNGRVSSAPATASDWKDILDICFDNREADIGRFLRRHLGPEASSALVQLLGGEGMPKSIRDRVEGLMAENETRMIEVLTSNEFKADFARFRDAGAWSVMATLSPARKVDDSDRSFLTKIQSSNPRYTGWPAWLDSSNFRDGKAHPRKVKRHWETIIFGSDVDFYRIHARGEFYLWRTLQDDTSEKVPANTVLDPVLVLYRVAEVIAVLLSFAKELDTTEGEELAILFKWQRLRGRKLKLWSDASRYISEWGASHTDEIEGFVQVPSDLPATSIAPYVKQATQELFMSFGGFSVNDQVIEQVVTKLLSRRF